MLLALLALAARIVDLRFSPSLTSFDDEGIYVAQAWAVLREGRLSPYTYVYDHAPAGWILLAGWMRLVGGPHAFGSAIDTGRALMVLLGGLSAPLLYVIARRLGAHPAAAAAGVCLYALSPLAVYYGRLVLLDTIMVFWLLLSAALLLARGDRTAAAGRSPRGLSLALSGLFFGLSVLSKESAFVFAPAMLVILAWALHLGRGRTQALGALATWAGPAVLVIGLYPLYAALRGELWPSTPAHILWFTVGGGTPHISLIDSLTWQASRGGGGLLSFHNMFWDLVRTDWLRRDPVTFVAGGVAVAVNLAAWIAARGRAPRLLAAALLGALPLVYLARGGLVYSFYVLDALPWLALNLAVVGSALPERGRSGTWSRVIAEGAAVAVVLAIGIWARTGSLSRTYAEQPAVDARDAIVWVKQHVPSESRLIINDNWWTDLHEPGMGGPAFPAAHSHWKVALETDVRNGAFHNDWRTVDYLFITAGTKEAFASTNNGVAQEALRRAHLVRSWGSGPEALELWQVDRPPPQAEALVTGSAEYIARRFGAGGAYAASDGTVLARNQAAALLRAVWSDAPDNRAAFAATWDWTRRALVKPSGLLASAWRGGVVIDGRTSSDADTDAALALLLAGKRWNDPGLEQDGRALVQSIWSSDVVTAGGTPYMVAGDWAREGPVLPVRTANLAPYAYHVFQEADSGHDWLGLVGSTYQILGAAAALQPAVPPGGWVGVDRATGAVKPLSAGSATVPAPSPEDAAQAAASTYLRIALHRRWTVNWSPGGDGRARAFLEQAQSQGAPDRTPPSAAALARTAGALAIRVAVNPSDAQMVFATQVAGPAQHDASAVWWGDSDDLETQQWGWTAAALYTDDLRDWWHAH